MGRVSLWRDVRDVLAIEAPSIGYGATEACPGVTHLPPGREPAEDGEIGFSLPQLQVEIAQDHLRATGPSICLASCQSGRWDAGRSLVLSDSLKTRDDGVLVFTTRSDLVMNRGGEKFSLEQIEREVSTAQGISCVAVAVPDARLGEELGLVVTGTPDRAAIFTRLRERFGRAFDPSRLVTVARIPVNTNGKPDRAACRALIERLGYPVPARKLGGWVPHRPPMVWVRDVVWSDGDGGACRVDSSCAPRTPAKWVECLAQAYAFVQAAERYCRDETPPASLPRAFLAGVSDFQLGEQAQDDGDWLVNVRRLHTLGPLSLVEGEVLRADGTVLARGKLKLYCEPAS